MKKINFSDALSKIIGFLPVILICGAIFSATAFYAIDSAISNRKCVFYYDTKFYNDTIRFTCELKDSSTFKIGDSIPQEVSFLTFNTYTLNDPFNTYPVHQSDLKRVKGKRINKNESGVKKIKAVIIAKGIIIK